MLDEGVILNITINADDPDGPPALSASGLPVFATFTDNGDGSALLNLAPGFDDAGVYPNLTVTASDGLLNGTSAFTLTVNDAAPAPTASFAALKGVTTWHRLKVVPPWSISAASRAIRAGLNLR